MNSISFSEKPVELTPAIALRFFSTSRDPAPPAVFPFAPGFGPPSFFIFILIYGPAGAAGCSSGACCLVGCSSSPTISWTILECLLLFSITSWRSLSSSSRRFCSSASCSAAMAACSASILCYSANS